METLIKDLENASLFALAKGADAGILKGITNWPQVSDFLVTRKLAGVFFKKLAGQGAAGLVPEAELERLRQFYYLIALKNKAMFSELKKVQDAFAGKNVNLVLLKGASLIMRGFFQPGERYLADLDFLIEGIERPGLRDMLAQAGYSQMEHSDRHWWSEEHFVSSGSKWLEDAFSISLEFHYTFRPLNRGSGEELAKTIFKCAQSAEYKGGSYRVPSAELQLYQAGIHGSAHHPFDSAYFWVSLADLAAIISAVKVDYSIISELAENQGMLEHLGVMSWLLTRKLGISSGLWEAIINKIPKMKDTMENTGQALWKGLLKPNPVSFTNLVYILGSSNFKDRVHACLQLMGLKKAVQFKMEGQRFHPPRKGFGAFFRSRIKRFNGEFIRLVWQMAKFYRKSKFRIPGDS